jgi:hypothetical protein
MKKSILLSTMPGFTAQLGESFQEDLKYTKKLTYEAGVRAPSLKKMETKSVVTEREKRPRDGNSLVCNLSLLGRVLFGGCLNRLQISPRRSGI